MSRRLSKFVLTSVACFGLLSASAPAQTTNKPIDPAKPPNKAITNGEQEPRRTTAPAGAGGAAAAPNTVVRVQRPSYDQNMQKQLDSDLASCLILENQNEVAMAKMAQEKSKNQEVKEFAKMLEQDHSKMVATLGKFTDHKFEGRTSGAQPSAAAGNQSLENVHRQMKHELAEQCLADATKELSSKSADKMDECFIGMQISGHMKMHTELTVMERHASSELQAVIADGMKTTEQHLMKAKELMANMDKQNKSNDK